MEVDLQVVHLDLVRATPKVSERRIPLVRQGDDFEGPLIHLLRKLKSMRKS